MIIKVKNSNNSNSHVLKIDTPTSPLSSCSSLERSKEKKNNYSLILSDISFNVDLDDSLINPNKDFSSRVTY